MKVRGLVTLAMAAAGACIGRQRDEEGGQMAGTAKEQKRRRRKKKGGKERMQLTETCCEENTAGVQCTKDYVRTGCAEKLPETHSRTCVGSLKKLARPLRSTR